MYYVLFNEITKAIDQLQEAQIETEPLYIDSEKPDQAPAVIAKEEEERS